MTFVELIRHFETPVQLFVVVAMLIVLGLPLVWGVRVLERKNQLPDDRVASTICLVLCVLGAVGCFVAMVCTTIHSLTLL